MIGKFSFVPVVRFAPLSPIPDPALHHVSSYLTLFRKSLCPTINPLVYPPHRPATKRSLYSPPRRPLFNSPRKRPVAGRERNPGLGFAHAWINRPADYGSARTCPRRINARRGMHFSVQCRDAPDSSREPEAYGTLAVFFLCPLRCYIYLYVILYNALFIYLSICCFIYRWEKALLVDM